jgi:hypothetical protein
VSYESRDFLCSSSHADVFLSIHCNACVAFSTEAIFGEIAVSVARIVSTHAILLAYSSPYSLFLREAISACKSFLNISGSTNSGSTNHCFLIAVGVIFHCTLIFPWSAHCCNSCEVALDH